MTKRPTQPTSRIAKMRVASAAQKSSIVDKVRVDPRVAALVVQTYEALSPKNRKAFAQMPTKQMVATAMKLQAAKAKPAKLQKKADAGNGLVYFVVHINDYDIESDRDSDDAEERARYDEFLDEDKDLTSAALGAELAMVRYVEAIVKKVLPGVRIGNEGHDNYGDLVCKFSVNNTEDLLKVKDAIERKFGSEGIIHSQLDSYTEATQFSFAPWDQKGPTEGLIPFSDLDEWLEDQQAKTARKASAKGKKSAGVKKMAKLDFSQTHPGIWTAYTHTMDVRDVITGKPKPKRIGVRIDGTEPGAFYADYVTYSGWQAIEHKPLKTLEAAKAFLEQWVAAVEKSGVASPKAVVAKVHSMSRSARTKKTASLRWDDKGQNVWVAENVEVRLSTYGKPRSMRVSLRIDGRRGNEFRVDMGALTGWEAIDDGPTRAPKTFEDAKALAERWVAAANEQGTLSPSDYKAAKVKVQAAAKPKVKRAGDHFGRINRGFADCIASNVFMDVMEEHGGSGYEVAAKEDLLRKCSAFLQDLYPAAELEADCEAFMATDPHVNSQHFGSAEEMYGWNLCMQTLGHGVGLYDYGYKTKLKKQYMEVGGYMTNLDEKYGTADILIDYPLELQGCVVETVSRQDVEKFTDDAVASDD